MTRRRPGVVADDTARRQRKPLVGPVTAPFDPFSTTKILALHGFRQIYPRSFRELGPPAADTGEVYYDEYNSTSGLGAGHAYCGGFLRDRRMPADVLPAGTSQDACFLHDNEQDIRELINGGMNSEFIDGLDMANFSSRPWRLTRSTLVAANRVDPRFRVFLSPDYTKGGPDAVQMTAAIQDFCSYPAAGKHDGKYLVAPFCPEAVGTTFWREVDSRLAAAGLPVHWLWIGLNYQLMLDQYATMPNTWGLSRWGQRNPAAISTEVNQPAQAHAKGLKYLGYYAPQDTRPYEGLFDEANGTEALVAAWMNTINGGAEGVQGITGMDMSEGSGLGSTKKARTSWLEINRYYVDWFARGTKPGIGRDMAAVLHRMHHSSVNSFTSGQPSRMVLRNGTPVQNIVEFYTRLTAPADAVAIIGGRQVPYLAPAGVHSERIPMLSTDTGSPSVSLSRGGSPVLSVTSRNTITTTPYHQDFNYYPTHGYSTASPIAPVASRPQAPSLTASLGAGSTVNLSWNVPADGGSAITGYVLRRRTGGGAFGTITTPTGTSFSDTSTVAGTGYGYQVAAVNAFGQSDFSTEVTITTAATTTTQASWYAFGAQPALTIPQLQTLARQHAGEWLAYTLTTTGMPPGMPAGAKRIQVPDQVIFPWTQVGGTVSEGIGYALCLLAWFGNSKLPAGIYMPGAQADFDAVWKYTKFYLDPEGLMNWSIRHDGTVADTGGATDGDEDIALGLMTADKVWGSAGAVNYRLEAEKMIDAVGNFEFTSPTYAGVGGPNTLMNGNNWGDDYDNIMFDYGAPGYYKEFGIYRNKQAEWNARITKYYQQLQFFHDNFTGGLVPDRNRRNGSTAVNFPNQGDWPNTYRVTYNSVRMGFRLAAGLLWHGPAGNELAQAMLRKALGRHRQVFGPNASQLQSPPFSLNVDGGPGYADNSGRGLIGPCALTDPADSTYAAGVAQAIDADGQQSYFNGGVGAMALAFMSGVARAPSSL